MSIVKNHRFGQFVDLVMQFHAYYSYDCLDNFLMQIYLVRNQPNEPQTTDHLPKWSSLVDLDSVWPSRIYHTQRDPQSYRSDVGNESWLRILRVTAYGYPDL